MAHPSPCQQRQPFDKGHLHGINAAPRAAEPQLGMALSAWGHAAQDTSLSPGQRAASMALSRATGEGDKFGGAPALPGALDAEPGCRQSCGRLSPASSRPRLDRAEPTHDHPCSSPGHPPCTMGPIHASSSPLGPPPPAPGAAASPQLWPLHVSPAENPRLDTKPKMIPNCSRPQKQEEAGKGGRSTGVRTPPGWG